MCGGRSLGILEPGSWIQGTILAGCEASSKFPPQPDGKFVKPELNEGVKEWNTSRSVPKEATRVVQALGSS